MSRADEFSLGQVAFEKVTPEHPMGHEYDHLMASTITASHNGQTVGEVGYGPIHDRREMAIQGLYVHPDYQHHGLASALMDKVVAETPPDWVVYHGTQTPAAQAWFTHYSQRPGFDPARHVVATRPSA